MEQRFSRILKRDFEMVIVTVVLEVSPDETPEDVVARFMPVAWAAGALKGDE